MRRRKIRKSPDATGGYNMSHGIWYPGDVSAMSQMMARDYSLAALDESELELKISERAE